MNKHLIIILSFILKELRVSVLNGLIVGLISFLFVGLYLTFIVPSDIAHLHVSPFAISGCIGISLFIAMIIAGLMAKGTTEIEDIYHIERGYEDIVEKLRAVGANISREAIKEEDNFATKAV